MREENEFSTTKCGLYTYIHIHIYLLHPLFNHRDDLKFLYTSDKNDSHYSLIIKNN